MSIQTVLRTLIASGFVVGAVAALSPAAFASATATNGGQVTGQITEIANVTYTPATATTTIAPDTNQTNQDFGSVNVQSNSNAGWKLEVASTNGSKLINSSATVAADGEIAYTLTVGGAAVDVSTPAGKVQAKNVTGLTDSGTGGGNYAVVGAIAKTASNGKIAGTYSDTLTFTLTNH